MKRASKKITLLHGEDEDQFPGNEGIAVLSYGDTLRLANRDHPRRAIRQGGARDAS